MRDDDSLKRSIFITGAANGIGRATARRFAEAGWFVGIADIDDEAAAALANDLGETTAMAFHLDVTRPEDWSAALEAFSKARGRLDVMLNNAGILISGPFCSNDLPKHHALVDVNVKGVLNGAYLAKPYLAATSGSCLINMSSTAAVYGQASLATYAATKFAVRGLTEGLSIEWQADGIRVIDIMPLFVSTRMVDGMAALSVQRMGIHLTAEDVAKIVLEAATYKGGPGRIHWPVGAPAIWMRRLTGLTPDRLSRYLMRRMAT